MKITDIATKPLGACYVGLKNVGYRISESVYVNESGLCIPSLGLWKLDSKGYVQELVMVMPPSDTLDTFIRYSYLMVTHKGNEA